MAAIIAETDCIGNEHFVLHQRLASTQFDAELFCRLAPGGTLGPIRGEDEFLAVSDMIIATGLASPPNNIRVHIGLHQNIALNRASPDDTTAFTFAASADVTGLDFFQGPAGVFPWGPNEPNTLTEQCVELFGNNGASSLNDFVCNNARDYILCKESCVVEEDIVPEEEEIDSEEATDVEEEVVPEEEIVPEEEVEPEAEEEVEANGKDAVEALPIIILGLSFLFLLAGLYLFYLSKKVNKHSNILETKA